MSKSTKSKSGQVKSERRRQELRRNLPRPASSAKDLLRRPEAANCALILLAFIIGVSFLVCWSREQILVRDGQIMVNTRLARLDYTVLDEDATRQARDEARQSSPRIYRLNAAYINELEAAISGLPQAVAGKTALNEISRQIVDSFSLTEDGLRALQTMTANGETIGDWKLMVGRLIENQLQRHPILDSQEYQEYSLIPAGRRALLRQDGSLEQPISGEAIEHQPGANEELNPQLRDLVIAAGFPADIVPFIWSRLAYESQPTIRVDAEATIRHAEMNAASVAPVLVEHARGEIIHRRGDRLTAKQYSDLIIERERFFERASPMAIWIPRLGVTGLVIVFGLFASVFVANAYARVLRKAWRSVALAVLLAGMLGLSIVLAVQVPQILLPAAIGPALLVAIILLLAYDQRLALFLGVVYCALLTIALNQGIGWFSLIMVGCGTMIVQLREVRNRNTLIRSAIVTAAVLGLGTIILGLLTAPIVEGIAWQILSDAAWAVGAALMTGWFLVLGILPFMERWFDITTGMTLAELRDPNQPLLRQLQQRAPGTYNHSLQIANIAEAAADAVGADGLLVYVGALYHDIGKMNKPDYFVENQAGGFNKHSKLRPAMSLLVIIGHVKDGIELAREYGLPRSIQHFIESHHGTTLVEYFYHAAKSQAESDQKESVAEVEFRYPGPKPRTKEAAILMLSDAVESATRAMSEPNPGRIEGLVSDLSRKRLLDGQFDESALTFRELSLIEDAMVARLCSIHHSRISYPSQEQEEAEEQTLEEPQAKPA